MNKKGTLIYLAQEQERFAKIGIDTAVENSEVITVGGTDCDYFDWSEFMITQIVEQGSKQFCQEFGWNETDLIEALQYYQDNDWRDCALDYFNGMEAA